MEKVNENIIVTNELSGIRLDQASAKSFNRFSRSQLKGWIESGQLTLNGKRADPKTKVFKGQVINLDVDLEPVIPIEPENIPLDIIHKDNDFYIINKPSGLVIHPGAGNHSGTLQNGLLYLDPNQGILPRAGIVHRLDKDTSGLIVVARKSASYLSLINQIKDRRVTKIYSGICNNIPISGGTIDHPISRNPRDRLKMTVNNNGKPAKTFYKVIEKFRAHCLLEIKIETGRTHQIRVHLSYENYPLLGDPIYGGRPILPSSPSNELKDSISKFKRQALHASYLSFIHPSSGKGISFTSSLPKDMSDILIILARDKELFVDEN
ncbi:MAG: RluA family pseudouridine synthase [Pseudomonadota bacterium]|nr:RNA pseudouridine synthase [Gammaproteobacteria bacterium]MEE2683754.1 RluA family pseudouridine synthase [Pseudomonadota bacterium]